jgi:uncharacterized protein (TIGR00288 family)
MADQQVCVLIDYENVGLSSIQWLFDQISDIGRIIVKRAYANWTSNKQQNELLGLGIEPIHVFRSGVSGKNSCDIRLAIDAVELLYQSIVDTFVVVSSDSDFIPLVSKLRAAGKTVVGAGRKATAPDSLVKSCDRYFYIDQADRPSTAMESSHEQQTQTLLARAMRATIDDQGKVIGSRLHQALQRLDPSFDFRALGFPTFTKYLEASYGVKVTRPKRGGDVTVELSAPNVVPVYDHTALDFWGPGIDAAWSKRATKPGDFIPGPAAAADAAEVLGVNKLSVSKYKTLQGLLDASNLLGKRWRRDGNTIYRL